LREGWALKEARALDVGQCVTTSYAQPSLLYAFALTDGSTRRLCGVAYLDFEVARRNIHTGHNAWDAEGRFYFAGFAGASDVPMLITRIDPAKLPFDDLAAPSHETAPSASDCIPLRNRARDIL
jgi:hypothetical protein